MNRRKFLSFLMSVPIVGVLFSKFSSEQESLFKGDTVSYDNFAPIPDGSEIKWLIGDENNKLFAVTNTGIWEISTDGTATKTNHRSF